jgi:hypothetical protein
MKDIMGGKTANVIKTDKLVGEWSRELRIKSATPSPELDSGSG